MLRALLFGSVSLVAVGCLAVGGTSAFAASCSSLSGPPGFPSSVPIGDFFETSGTKGLLDGFPVGSYPQCTVGSTTYFIPFYETATAKVEVVVADLNYAPSVTTQGFDIDVGSVGGALTPYSLGANGAGTEFSVTLAAPGGVDLLGITDIALNGASANATDVFEVSIQFENYIPEPATLGLLGFAAACLAGLHHRRRRLRPDTGRAGGARLAA